MSNEDTSTALVGWQTLSRRPLLDRAPWLIVWEEDVLLPSGYRIDGYVLAETRPYAMVFAVTQDGRVPLVRQYKHGPRALALDLPAGYLDHADEDPLACAQRELAEETGCVGGVWLPLGSFLLDSNRSRACAHLFLATGVTPAQEQHLDPSEQIAVELLPIAEVAARARRGEIASLSSMAAIFLALDALASPHDRS